MHGRHIIPIRLTARSRNSKSNGTVADDLEDRPRNSVIVQREKGQAKDSATPLATVKKQKRREKKILQTMVIRRLALKRHRRARTMTRVEEREKDKRQRTPSSTKAQPTPKPKVSNSTGTTPSRKEGRPPCYSYNKGGCLSASKHPPFWGTMQNKNGSSLRPHQ